MNLLRAFPLSSANVAMTALAYAITRDPLVVICIAITGAGFFFERKTRC